MTMIPRSLPIYIKKIVLFIITIKLFKIHDAQIILDSDNNKFLFIYFLFTIIIIKICVISLP